MSLDQIKLYAIMGSLLLIFLILELIRRNYLKERHSLLWLTTGVVFFLLSLTIEFLSPLARFLGFRVVSNALFLAGIIFLVMISLGMTIAISRLSERNKRLTQEVVLLKKRVEDLEKKKSCSDLKR
jgi:hypothetical protein